MLLGSLAEYVGRLWAAENAIGARGIDCCGGAFRVVMVEEKDKEAHNLQEVCILLHTMMGAPFYSKIYKSCTLYY